MSFFHFPLPLLFCDGDYHATLQRISSWCCYSEGIRIHADLSDQDAKETLSGKSYPHSFVLSNRSHRELLLGCDFLNVSPGGADGMLERCDASRRVIEKFERADPSGKRSPLVFVDTGLFWKCHDEGDPSWRHFSAICAINSIIGMNNFRPVLIRREMIQARMTGHKSMAHFEAAHSHIRKSSRPELISTSRLRTTLDALEIQGFFIRIPATRRRTFFATAKKADKTPQDRTELLKEIKAKLDRAAELKARHNLDREFLGTRKPEAIPF